jgi:hypothetical protein
MQLKFSRQIFEKASNTEFHHNPSRGSRVVAYRQTDMKPTVNFRNFAKAPKKSDSYKDETNTHRSFHKGATGE